MFKAPEWKLEDNSAGELQVSLIIIDKEEEDIELIPYGCAKLRVPFIPWNRKKYLLMKK